MPSVPYEWNKYFSDSKWLCFIKSSFLKVRFVVETLKVFVLKRKLEMHFKVELVTFTHLVSPDFNWVWEVKYKNILIKMQNMSLCYMFDWSCNMSDITRYTPRLYTYFDQWRRAGKFIFLMSRCGLSKPSFESL